MKGRVMLVRYCFITVVLKETISPVVLQIEMRPHKDGSYSDPTDKEVDAIVASYAKHSGMTVLSSSWDVKDSLSEKVQ